MIAKFIGRKEELQILKGLFNRRSASLIVIKGRRRIGKSRLLEEFSKAFQKSFKFSGLPPKKELEPTTSQSQRDEFAIRLAKQTNTSDFNKDDWTELFWHLANYTKHGRVLIIFDEISWMGSKDPNFLGKLKNAWDLSFKKMINLF